MISLENKDFDTYKNCLGMWKIGGKKLLPRGLKSCPINRPILSHWLVATDLGQINLVPFPYLKCNICNELAQSKKCTEFQINTNIKKNRSVLLLTF